MKLVKAEILWTGSCKLACSYCSLNTGEQNRLDSPRWFQIFHNLKNLGCKFAAFYGAEPLEDFFKLPIAIKYCEKLGIKTTVITSGVTKDFEYKIKSLYQFGLRSLSMSYDLNPLDKSSGAKSNNAVAGLDLFESFGPVRDTAYIVTLTRDNYQGLPDLIRSTKGTKRWVFFDFLHKDRGQPHSKCKNYPGIEDLLFKSSDIVDLKRVLDEVMFLKDAGYNCHTSKGFVDLITEDNGSILKLYDWNCAHEPTFPAWVTINHNGDVYPCDDYHSDLFSIKGWELEMRWDEFVERNREQVILECPGCIWNTHIDAHLIKAGILPVEGYTHG